MEFVHLRLRFHDEGLIIEFLNDEGQVAIAVDKYWIDDGLKMTDSLYELRKFVLIDYLAGIHGSKKAAIEAAICELFDKEKAKWNLHFLIAFGYVSRS